jgi:tetratricopeptide (TPR) repeat protein
MRFPALILRRVAEIDAAPFESALRELVAERLLVADPGLGVEFAHQITRLATYEGIPRTGRARLHARVLEVALADRQQLALSNEALADHARRAGDKAKALDFLWQASREAIAHSAVQSVAELRRRALAICAEIGAAADMREVDFNLLAFDALQQQGAFRDLVAPLERALALSEAAGAKRQVCQVSGHLATTYWVIGEYERAYAKARRALAEARDARDLPLASYAQYVLGCVQFHRGRIAEAARLERELIEHLSGVLETARFGAVVVLSVTCRAFLSWFATDLGDFAEAEANNLEAMRVANAMQQPYSQLLAHAALGYRLFREGRIEEACAALEIAYGMCRAGNFLALDATISGWFASALVRSGRDQEAARVAQRVIDHELGRYGCLAGTYYVYDAKARLLANAGRADAAMQALEHGIAAMRTTRDRPHYAFGLFTRGELKRALGVEADTAVQDFRWALRRARRLGMRPLEAECGRALDAAG